MREIKFLAYVNNPIHGKGVFPVKSIHFDPFVCEVVMGNEIVNFFDFDDITLLEYTGLKDSDGKEIYEGDIVKWTRVTFEDCSRTTIEKTEDIIGEVYWAETMWAIGDRSRGYLLMPHFKDDVFEVLGNKYEHPHLLGGEEE
jgi:uncharacterized phage protein (TIGR01671 family)